MRLNRLTTSMLALIFAVLTEHYTLARNTKVHAEPKILSNQKAIANGAAVYSAVCSGDSSNRKIIQRLLGAIVVFEGVNAQNNAPNLLLNDKVMLDIDMPRWKRPQAFNCTAKVAGRLESVDFQRRVIHIRAKQDNWRVGMQL